MLKVLTLPLLDIVLLALNDHASHPLSRLVLRDMSRTEFLSSYSCVGGRRVRDCIAFAGLIPIVLKFENSIGDRYVLHPSWANMYSEGPLLL